MDFETWRAKEDGKSTGKSNDQKFQNQKKINRRVWPDFFVVISGYVRQKFLGLGVRFKAIGRVLM